MNSYRIFIIEDDEVIAGALSRHLESWGYTTGICHDFSNVLAEFGAFRPQLVVLDISLPFYNGFHWCTEIRRISQVPVIFLSSASDGMNMVTAMNMGGDDFVAKPFELPVLTAKIQALLRRTYDFGAPAELLEWNGAMFNLSDGTLAFNGLTIELTRNEQKILQLLLRSRGHIVSRETLMQQLWESDAFVDENTLTVNVARLRKKLSDAGFPDNIRTKKGTGYLIA